MDLLFVWEIGIVLFSGVVYFGTLLSNHSILSSIIMVVIFNIGTMVATFFVAKEDCQVKPCFLTILAVIIACLNPILCFPMSFLFTAILISVVDKKIVDIEFFSLLGVNIIIYFMITHGPKILEKVTGLF